MSKNQPITNNYDPAARFLTSAKGHYSYADLCLFGQLVSKCFHNGTIDKMKPLAIYASSSDALILAIAGCWLHGIAIRPLNAALPQRNGDVLKAPPAALLTDQPDASIDLPTIDINVLWDDFCEARSGNNYPKSNRGSHNQENIFGYFQTSGTTGEPKTVPLKRRQMIAAARASRRNISPDKNDHWLLCMPLHHIGGISLILRSLLYGSAVYRAEGFDAQATGQLLAEKQEITVASLVPTMLERLLSDTTWRPHRNFNALLLGGGPLSKSTLKEALARNIPVLTSYGMTETCAQIAAFPHPKSQESQLMPQCVGPIFTPNDVQIRNEAKKAGLAGTSGQIWLRGPQIFEGYQGHEESSHFSANGWFNTGDFGRLDNQNRLYIETRRTDRIITGGENVSPHEVEEALRAVAGIADAAVVGLPHEEWGQQVAAAVVFNDDTAKLSAVEIKKQLQKKIESFKIPKVIIALKTLPHTSTGKIERAKLADKLTDMYNQSK